jgi:hypothetical protein
MIARGKYASPLFGFFFAAPAALTSQAADAQDWVALPSTTANITFAVDVANIERNGDVVTFAEKLTYTRADQIDEASGRAIKEKRVRRVMNCKDKTQGMLIGSMHSESGTLIEQVTVDPKKLQMAPVPSGSLAARELELVCSWDTEVRVR